MAKYSFVKKNTVAESCSVKNRIKGRTTRRRMRKREREREKILEKERGRGIIEKRKRE